MGKGVKRALGPGAKCCGEGCGMAGCEAPAKTVDAPVELNFADEMSGEDK